MYIITTGQQGYSREWAAIWQKWEGERKSEAEGDKRDSLPPAFFCLAAKQKSELPFYSSTS